MQYQPPGIHQQCQPVAIGAGGNRSLDVGDHGAEQVHRVEYGEISRAEESSGGLARSPTEHR